MNVLPEEWVYEDEETELPEIWDWAVELETGKLLLRDGKPYMVAREAALKQWIYKALRTKGDDGGIYGEKFGSDFDGILGSTDFETVTMELKSNIEETLCASPYIEAVSDFAANRMADGVDLTFSVESVYGVLQMQWEATDGDL